LFKREIRLPILALFLVSFGGLLLHIRIHSPRDDAFNLVPVVSGIISTLILPLLFNYRRTVAWAYMLNLIGVALGTVTMAHYSIVHWQGAVTLDGVILKSTFPDIVVLLAKVPLGHEILKHFRPKAGQDAAPERGE
jgi:hypothetical protein